MIPFVSSVQSSDSIKTEDRLVVSKGSGEEGQGATA